MYSIHLLFCQQLWMRRAIFYKCPTGVIILTCTTVLHPIFQLRTEELDKVILCEWKTLWLGYATVSQVSSKKTWCLGSAFQYRAVQSTLAIGTILSLRPHRSQFMTVLQGESTPKLWMSCHLCGKTCKKSTVKVQLHGTL